MVCNQMSSELFLEIISVAVAVTIPSAHSRRSPGLPSASEGRRGALGMPLAADPASGQLRDPLLPFHPSGTMDTGLGTSAKCATRYTAACALARNPYWHKRRKAH